MKLKSILRLVLSMALVMFLLTAIMPTARADASVRDISSASDLSWGLYYLSEGTNGYQSGDTFRLTNDITYMGNVAMDGKSVIFDLNGHTLTIENTVGVLNGGVISLTGQGQLNVKGSVFASGSGSSATISNIEASTYAVSVNGGNVTVNGNITVNTAYTDISGVNASGNGSTVTVNGNITVNGNFSSGVKTNSGSMGTQINVNGNITASGANSSGVLIVGSSNTVSVTGNVAAVSAGVNINNGSGNIATVDGSVTVSGSNGKGATIGFGSGHSLTITGNITVNGDDAYGALVTSGGNEITVDGSVYATGNDTYGVQATSGGTVKVNKDVITAFATDRSLTIHSYGVYADGSSSVVAVGGDVSASNYGAYAVGGGTVTVDGNVSASVSDTYNYQGVYANSGGMVSVGGDVSISGTSSVTGAYANGSSSVVTVDGSVSSNSTGSSATGVYANGGRIEVEGDVAATGTSYVTGVSSYAGTVTVGGVSASGGTSSNTGVYASGSSSVTVDKAIAATNYIKMYSTSEITFNIGGGTLNSGYFEYTNASNTVRVKAWALTAAAGTGGLAGIGGTSVTSGFAEAGKEVSLTAEDTVAGYNFQQWTSSAGGTFDSESSASAKFTMPANDTTVTADFQTVPVYAINISAMTGGSVTASPSPAEEGDSVTLTVTPDAGKMLRDGSLKYSYNSTDYTLSVTNNTAVFVMPAEAVTVSADYEDITVPTITTATLPKGSKSVSYSRTLSHSSNGAAEWSLASGDLPDGLSLSQDGVISGTPSAEGTYTFTVKAENAGGSVTQELTLVIAPEGEPVIITESLPDAEEDVNYSVLLEAINGSYWYIPSDSSLPDGLYLSWEGEIYGTPSAAGTYTFTVVAETFNIFNFAFDTKEFTLTVDPAPTYALTLEAGDHGSITGGTSGNYKAGAEISITAEPDTGYAFSGWASSDGGSFDDASSASTNFIMPAANVTVTAEFKEVTDEEKVAEDQAVLDIGYASGDSAASVTQNLNLTGTGAVYGSSITWVSGNPAVISNSGVVTRPSFTSGDATVTVTATVYNAEASDTKEFQLVVLKLPQETYTVAFNENGGDTEADPNTITVALGENIENLPIPPTRSNYAFNGWNTAADGSGTTFSAATAVTGNLTIYAQWTINSYTVTFDKNGGDVDASPATKTVNHGENVGSLPTEPTRVGYTFAGWNTAADGSGTTFSAATAVTGNLTVYAQWTINSYTVTFDKNGGDAEASPATKTLNHGGNVGSLPTAPTRVGYTFNGWNTAANGSGTAFTATTPVTSDLTVYAQWTANSSTGSGGSSSGSNAGSSSITVSGNISTATTTTAATADSSGKASAAVPRAQVSDAISKAVTEAEKQGEGSSARVEIKVEGPANATTVETSIPKEAVSLAADSRIQSFTVSTQIASLTFDDKALSTISGEASGDIKITSSRVDTTALPAETQQLVGDRPVFNFNVTSGNKSISEFGGNVSVSVPYSPKPGEDTNAIVIYYINKEGKLEIVGNCAFDPVTGTVRFNTNHFSRYAVGYNKVSFKDVAANAWHNKAVSFIAARGITAGTGKGNYSPEARLTRGEFIVMMMRAYGIAPDANRKDNFADAGNTYYTDYLVAAKRLGISGGVGNNLFAPEKEITRQEMFTLLYKTLKTIGKLPQGNSDKSLSAFSDTGDIHPWAKDAMKLLVEAGTISGSNGKLSPTATTTRAEMAQVLYKLFARTI